jgi:hypothetical protein
VFSGPCLAEECIERVVPASDGLVARHLAVWLYSVLQTVQLPAGIANLHSRLTNMNRNNLTLQREVSSMKC